MKRKGKRISEREFEAKLARLLDRALAKCGGRAGTFKEHGMLADDRGLVVELPNGQEFELTIVETT